LLEPLSPRHRLRVPFRRRCSLMAYRPNPLRGIESLALRLVHVVPVLRFKSVKFPLESIPCGMDIRARPLTLTHQLGNELLWLVEDERSRISRHIAPSGGASPKQSLATARSAECHRTRELALGCSTSAAATGRTSRGTNLPRASDASHPQWP